MVCNHLIGGNSYRIDAKSVTFNSKDGIKVENLLITEDNTPLFFAKSLFVEFNLWNFLNRNKSIISKISSFQTQMESSGLNLFFSNIDLSVINRKQILCNLNSRILSTDFNCKGIINPEDIKSYYKPKLEVKNRLSYLDYIKNSDFPKNVSWNVFFNIANTGYFDANTRNSLSINDGIISSNFNLRKNSFNVDSFINEIDIPSDFQNLNFRNIQLNGSYIKQADNSFEPKFSLGAEKILFDGVINGEVNKLDLDISFSEKNPWLRLYSSNNDKNCSILISKLGSKNSIRGFCNLNPDSQNLKLSKDENLLSFFSGKKIKLKFIDSLNLHDQQFSPFYLIANKVSVLNSPEGNFSFRGQVNHDLSLKVEDAIGHLGKCKVRGSFSQEWFPHLYQFNLIGNCFPPDINNWLGKWWKKIWIDFDFQNNIPFGDFKITGEWGGGSLNSKTFGIVDSGVLSYKGCETNSSKIEVRVDSNSTYLRFKSLSHSKGNLMGAIEFPRIHTRSPKLLNFQIDGVYPLDSGRSVFGNEFKKSIADLNCSAIACNVKGTIYRQNSGFNRNNTFIAKFSNLESFYFNGVKFDKIEGILESEGNNLSGYVSKFELCDGTGSINFDLTSKNQSKYLSFDLALNDVSKNEFIDEIRKSVNTAWPQDSIKIADSNSSMWINNADKGRVSLNLQARGPFDNFLQFEGTGKLSVSEKKISQINILGGISNEISKLPIPFPDGALSFNQLIVPFELINESVVFDNLEIKGPISKITAKGSVNLATQNLDVFANVHLAGNLPIPLIGTLIEYADPLSNLTEIQITGPVYDPKWKILLSPE